MPCAKYLFDKCVAFSGLLALSPLFFFLCALIWLEDRGSPFFRQERVGQFGVPFSIWKFRTMGAPRSEQALLLTVGEDARITRIGKHLRRWKLDELPQLFNILRGEMSFVGPRPEVARYVAHYTEAERRVLEHRPGITDVSSIAYSKESEILALADDPEHHYITKLMPRKVELSLAYAAEANLLKDVQVILETLQVIKPRWNPTLWSQNGMSPIEQHAE